MAPLVTAPAAGVHDPPRGRHRLMHATQCLEQVACNLCTPLLCCCWPPSPLPPLVSPLPRPGRELPPQPARSAGLASRRFCRWLTPQHVAHAARLTTMFRQARWAHRGAQLLQLALGCAVARLLAQVGWPGHYPAEDHLWDTQCERNAGCDQCTRVQPTTQSASLDDITTVTWWGATRGLLLTVQRPAACIAAHRRQVAIFSASRQPRLRALLDSARRQNLSLLLTIRNESSHPCRTAVGKSLSSAQNPVATSALRNISAEMQACIFISMHVDWIRSLQAV